MKHIPYALLPLLLLMIACTGGRQHAAMQQALAELERCNQADSLLTDDSLAIALTQYFDRRGTANERMHAHYLLGRTYADRGEAPQAIAAYQTAAEQADTTAPDCDYRLLCRVYSQMSVIYYRQNLIDEQLYCLNKALVYAHIASDTFSVLNLQAQKISTYCRLEKPDSVVSVYESIYFAYCAQGLDTIAARYSSAPIKSYLQKGNLVKARHCIEVYESKSGYFDENHNIDKGREFYYNQKGHYYLSTHQYDSAEYCFRKELSTGKDYYNQQVASAGLANVYQLTNRVDSVAKYYHYSYIMIDSVYKQMATDAVVNAQGLFNYTSHQREAAKERERASQEERKASILAMTLLIIFIIVGIIAYRWMQKRKKEREDYQRKLDELEAVQSEILKLRSHEEDFNILLANQKITIDEQEAKVANMERRETEVTELIKKKEAVIEQLQGELTGYKEKERLLKQNAEDLLAKAPMYEELLLKANKGGLLDEEHWQGVHRLVIEILPQFYKLVSSKKYDLNEKQYRVCILLRLKITPLSISLLMGIHPSYVTKLSKQASEKLFNCQQNSAQLAEKLSAFS